MLKRCEDFRAARLQSLDRFKVEEDRSKEELDEEEALSKRLKLAFKAAKVNAAKKKEQKAKYVSPLFIVCCVGCLLMYGTCNHNIFCFHPLYHYHAIVCQQVDIMMTN